MSTEPEQLVLAAARVQLTWHYAQLLSAKQHREDALLRRPLGPESEQDVADIKTELAELEQDIGNLRGQASHDGVLHSELDEVLGALKRERGLLAAMVAAELRGEG